MSDPGPFTWSPKFAFIMEKEDTIMVRGDYTINISSKEDADNNSHGNSNQESNS